MLKRPPFLLGLVVAALLTSGCSSARNQPDSGERGPRSFIYAPAAAGGASLRAASESDAAEVARTAERIAEAPHLIPGYRPRRVESAAIPLIHDSPEGRALALFPAPVALAEGDPAERCAARAAVAGRDLRGSIEGALNICLAQLAELSPPAGPECGCRLLAAGDKLFAPPAAFRYAPGISARVVSRGAGLDLTLVAEERYDADGGRVLLLRPAPGGGEAAARIGEDGTATLVLDGRTWKGRAIAEGFERGRRRERLYLTREDGARLALIVGWEPVAYAMERERLLTWSAS